MIGFHKYLETGEIIYRFKTILDILDHNDLTLIEMPDAKMVRVQRSSITIELTGLLSLSFN